MLAESPIEQPKPKGGILLWVGILLVVVGVGVGVWIVVDAVRGVARTVDNYQRVPVATGGEVVIDEPGTYRLFLERPGADDTFAAVWSVGVRVIGPEGEVVVESDALTETYNIGGHAGRNIGRFRADTPGTYDIGVSMLDGSSPVGEIAVGRNSPIGGLGRVVGGILGAGLLVLLGIVLLIIGAVQRSRSRKATLGGGAPVPGWAPPPVPAPGWSSGPGTVWTPPGTPPPPPGSAWTPPGTPSTPPPPGAWPPPGPAAQPAPGPGGWAPPPPAPGGWAPPPVDAPPAWTPPPPAPPVWTPPPVAPASPPEAPAEDQGPIS